MYIAMNRFKVSLGSEEDFEAIWKNRDSSLENVPGFVDFKLLRCQTKEDQDYCLFSSHTVWRDEAAFIDWTKSQNFRDAHRNAGDNKPLYQGHPEFEGFSVVEGA